MHMLIVLGSPRKNGNSETLAKAVAEGLAGERGTVEYVRLNDLSLRPCQGCGGCDKTGICVVKDDMGAIYEQVDAADRLLVVSPVYFYALTAQTKIFTDRFQARWARRYLQKVRFKEGEGRRGYLLATAATKGARVFECSQLSARYLFDAMDMECGESLLLKGVDKRKDILKHPQELERAREFGRKIGSGEI
jgi:multimeric flavodoxin WrbA